MEKLPVKDLQEEIKQLTKKVRYCLKEFPETRNSDERLTIVLWSKFHPDLLDRSFMGRAVVPIENVMKLPSQDKIKRIRANIQNKHKLYPPTIWEVAEQRDWAQAAWKEVLGYG